MPDLGNLKLTLASAVCAQWARICSTCEGVARGQAQLAGLAQLKNSPKVTSPFMDLAEVIYNITSMDFVGELTVSLD